MDSYSNPDDNRHPMMIEDATTSNEPPGYPVPLQHRSQRQTTVWDHQHIDARILTIVTSQPPPNQGPHTRYYQYHASLLSQPMGPCPDHTTRRSPHTDFFPPQRLHTGSNASSVGTLRILAPANMPSSPSSTSSHSTAPGSDESRSKKYYECPLCHFRKGDGTVTRSWKSPIRFRRHMEAEHVELFRREDSTGFLCWLCRCSGQHRCSANIADQSKLVNHLATVHGPPTGPHRHNVHICSPFFPNSEYHETLEDLGGVAE